MMHQDLTRAGNPQGAPAFAALRVSVIADLICPWCYLGKRRLDTALKAVHGPRELHWLPFQLNPGMPAAGMGFEEYLASRFGDPAKIQPGLDALTTTGKAEGIHFRFDLMKQVPNTLNAHLLLHHAEREGANLGGVAEDLLSGFFEEGLDIASNDVLADIGGNQGLARHGVLRALVNDSTREQVLAKEAEVRRRGVTAVPNFLINDRVFVVGAQPTDVLVDAFDQAMFGEHGERPVSDTVH